ncbi:MAG: cell division protein ZipA C-terminal FtsZ-binding domain-containing protein [Betaproteobacteria bacterium]|nr:cell division protein ZipA C-terminal FtsZ-binding domain-containing protein [Betaproteobacteria bacterium]
MAISELQIALIGAGAIGVAIVWGYNVWQDRQHRKTADRIFNGEQDDALLGPEADVAAVPEEDSERREPRFADAADPSAAAVDEAISAIPVADAAVPTPDVVPVAALPAECADDVADCVIYLTAAEPIPASALWVMQNVWSGDLEKALHWLIRNEVDGSWRRSDANDSGRYREWVAALQLVDRRGPVSDGELGRFYDGVQQIALQTGATLEMPTRGDTLMRAGALDEFCAAVDIQFVLHVVEATGGVFAGTKLRGVAEAAGLALEADGVLRARDAVGGELFSVANLGNERLDAETIKSLATHGLTLSLDVPRVSDGVQAFDRMLATARQLAGALGGVLVDAQRAPLADAMIAAIRAKTAELQQRMHDAGIVPGSTRALRLFS